MVFVATTASIVSGTLAERVKLWSFFAFILVLTALIYPIVGAWTWGGGWLSDLGFQDFAGSTIVPLHGEVGPPWQGLWSSVQEPANSAGDGSVKSTPPSNVPAVTLGVFILWLGWFGFNGGSPTRTWQRRRCGGHEYCSREHQSGCSGRGAGGRQRFAPDLRESGPSERAQRGDRRPGWRLPQDRTW